MEQRRGRLSGTTPLFNKYRFCASRYACYPIADRFTPGFGPGDLREALAARARLAARRALVFAVQLEAPGIDPGECLDAIHREAAMVNALLGGDRPHALGIHGPSAALATDARFGSLLEFLEKSFGFSEAGRFAEIDAKHAAPAVLDALHRNGFNRLRLRCRDADDDTALPRAFQKAAAVLGAPPDVSLSHGRLSQTPAGLAAGIEQAVRGGARCIVLNGDEAGGAVLARAARAALLARAIDTLCAAGYENAGLDVFVPGGPRNGSPFRSRYDVLGLGPGAITACGETYMQNRSGEAYAAALLGHAMPVMRGHRMSADDVLRRDIIHSLECLGTVSFSSLEYKYGVAFEQYFAPQLAMLEDMQDAGLIELYADAIEVTPAGRPVVRLVAALFDRYLESGIAIETEKAWEA